MSDVVDRMLAAMNAHDIDAVLRCFAPDAVAVGPEMEAGNLDEIASYILQMWEGFPDLRLTLSERIGHGDALATELLATGTHRGPYLIADGQVLPPTGRFTTLRVSWFWHTAGDLVVSQRYYYDQLELYSQLGLRMPLTFDTTG
ncbi:nuclear transport factor 2 family protein [Microbispora hainanensis]|uniref:ester cyclase n=1 Tax=Microbispora hainanensis TaxID=568844 RepID=UPI0033EA064B